MPTALAYTIDRDRRIIRRLSDGMESKPIQPIPGVDIENERDPIHALCYVTWLIEESDHYDKFALANLVLAPYFTLFMLDEAFLAEIHQGEF